MHKHDAQYLIWIKIVDVVVVFCVQVWSYVFVVTLHRKKVCSPLVHMAKAISLTLSFKYNATTILLLLFVIIIIIIMWSHQFVAISYGDYITLILHTIYYSLKIIIIITKLEKKFILWTWDKKNDEGYIIYIHIVMIVIYKVDGYELIVCVYTTTIIIFIFIFINSTYQQMTQPLFFEFIFIYNIFVVCCLIILILY